MGPDVERLASRINEVCQSTTLDLALKVGELIVTELYCGAVDVWEREGTASLSYRALAARPDLPLSPSALCRSVAVFALVQRLGGRDRWRKLAVSHFKEVLPLPQTEQERLLLDAEVGGWTVSQLRQQVSAARARTSPGRGVQSLVKALRRVRADVTEQHALLVSPGAVLQACELAELADAVEQLREALGSLSDDVDTQRRAR